MDKKVFVVVLSGTGHETHGDLQIVDIFLNKEVAAMRRANLERNLRMEADQEWSAEVREFPLNEVSPEDY